MADKAVSIYVCRDLDSELPERESNVVKEWMKTSLPLYATRDHWQHGTHILGETTSSMNKQLY